MIEWRQIVSLLDKVEKVCVLIQTTIPVNVKDGFNLTFSAFVGQCSFWRLLGNKKASFSLRVFCTALGLFWWCRHHAQLTGTFLVWMSSSLGRASE